jgi:hypothetical protein
MEASCPLGEIRFPAACVWLTSSAFAFSRSTRGSSSSVFGFARVTTVGPIIPGRRLRRRGTVVIEVSDFTFGTARSSRMKEFRRSIPSFENQPASRRQQTMTYSSEAQSARVWL